MQNAYHALAVDENREPYAATLWGPQAPKDRAREQTLEQVWFSGAHADVGGGYTGTHPVSDLTLRWMQKKASACGLDVAIIPAPSEDSLLNCELHDSFKEFLKGVFSWFTHRYYRPIGESDGGPQTRDPLVQKRAVSRADYRPKNKGLFETQETNDPR